MITVLKYRQRVGIILFKTLVLSVVSLRANCLAVEHTGAPQKLMVLADVVTHAVMRYWCNLYLDLEFRYIPELEEQCLYVRLLFSYYARHATDRSTSLTMSLGTSALDVPVCSELESHAVTVVCRLHLAGTLVACMLNWDISYSTSKNTFSLVPRYWQKNFFKYIMWGFFPDGPVVNTPCFQKKKKYSMLPMQGAWVWTLIGELRSCIPHGSGL